MQSVLQGSIVLTSGSHQTSVRSSNVAHMCLAEDSQMISTEQLSHSKLHALHEDRTEQLAGQSVNVE